MTPIALVIVLILTGLALVVVEVLVIPGFGLIGLLGGGAILAGGWISYSQLSPSAGVIAWAGGLAAAGLMLWLLPKTRAARKMVLQARHEGAASDPALAQLVGQEGITITALRPAGTARFDGRPVDVVSDGQFVEQDTPVRVVQVEGARVVVEPR